MGWHKTRHKTKGLQTVKAPEMTQFRQVSGSIGEAENGLANRWFQPLTHVSGGGSTRDCADYCQRDMREKRGEHRFAVAQRAAQFVLEPFARRWQAVRMTDPATLRDLADRIDAAYQRAKLFPERNPRGQIALIDLRSLAPETVDALRDAAAEQERWVEIERMRLGER